MAAYVPLELSKFSKNCKYLRRVLNETVSAFDEITRTEFFSQDELQSIGIYPKDHTSLMSTLNRSPCILVLGYSRRARAQVVNELFCRRMLPIVRDPPLEKPEFKDVNVINSESSHPEGPSGDFDKPVGYWPWRAVRFRHGSGNHAHHGGVSTATISLMLPNSFELIENLASHQKPYSTIPRVDLELTPEHLEEPSYFSSTLEVTMKHVLLRDDSQVIVAPCHLGSSKNHSQTHYWSRFLNNTLQDVLPVCIYALSGHSLCPEEVDELRLFKELAPQVPIFFLVVATSPASPSSHLTECEQHELQQHENNRACETGKGKISFDFKANTSGRQRRHTSAQSSFRSPSPANESKTRLSAASLQLHRQLSQLGFSFVNVPVAHRVRRGSASLTVSSELCEQVEGLPGLLPFARLVLQAYLITASSTLYDTHHRCLRMFILSAFDWARQMQITPRRIEYARKKEAELYSTLLGVASKKQEEIRTLIVDTLATMQDELLVKAEQYVFQGVDVEDGQQLSALQLQRCTDEIQDMVLNTLNSAVAEKLIGSVEYLRERFIGTLQRCLESLERSCRQAGEEVQASNALKQILTAAYQVQITVRTSSSFIRSLWEHFRNLLRALPWSSTPRLDKAWKRNVAENMLESLSEAKMARLICAQFRERLRSSHDAFQAALRQMETAHSGRLERTEEQCLRVRKVHAPRVARLALEAISLRDMVLYGMPQLGREVGRGQYGVVYGCETWGGYSPCAVKSVVPPDDKHWNDLSLEFYYSRMVPEHDRIITIRGSVIDHSYGVGSSPAVLLIMDRLSRDLYTAIKAGLPWPLRLQVALDVVQGIRFLHSQGLVHRDIKLKNVLLDSSNRAKITDLGFCKPEAMMSGSIVGTPIHMAPELFSGRYDNSVDVYAFGILFWYLCAGHARLPYVFEQCQNKDQLWQCVKRGARPERLPHFDDVCWRLMEECWAGEPADRPLLGHVEPRLENLARKYNEATDTGMILTRRELDLHFGFRVSGGAKREASG